MKLTKKCPYCGKELPMPTRQCVYCGQMQPDSDATQLQSGYNDATQFQEPSTMYGPPPISTISGKKSKMKYLLILLAALLLIGGGVAAYFLFFDKDGSSRSRSHEVISSDDEDDDESDDRDAKKGKKKAKKKKKVKEDWDDLDAQKDPPAQRVEQDEKVEDVKAAEPVKAAEQVKAVEPVKDPAPPVETKYYNYTGNITYKSNVYSFRMNLTVDGNRVNGGYVVTNGENVWVTLSGTVDSNGKAIIREYKGGSPTTYYFDGYLNGSSFSGKYKTTSRPLVMNFYASSY